MKSENEDSRDHLHAEPIREGGFLREIATEVRVSVIAVVVLAVIVCGIYPAIVWGISSVLFPRQAGGSLIGRNGQPVSEEKQAVGSALIGQSFSDPKYFHGRPSSAGNGYDATASGGSNLGPTSAKLMFGTTKNVAYTVFAAAKGQPAVVPVVGRAQGTVTAVSRTSITIDQRSGAGKQHATYALDPAVADPNAVVNFHRRTVHAATIPNGALVELKLSDKTPPTVLAINVADQEVDAGISAIDVNANKITLSDSSGTVVNVDPKSTAFIVNGKPGATLSDLTTDMSIHAVVAVQEDFDGIADRVIHYCQDNNIGYKSSVPDSAFTDADGIDNVRLIAAFNAATDPTITPAKPIPADAVTGSGSGLDPHISVANAQFQAARVAKVRNLPPDRVNELIQKSTDAPSVSFLGDPGVNVLRLNLALDSQK